MTGMPRACSFDQPVPRSLVHRRSTGEVLPTDWRRISANHFEVGLQWPRRHWFFHAPLPDSALVAESIRQAAVLLCHVAYDVPADTRFLMSSIGFEIRADGQIGAQRGEAIELVVEVRVRDTQRAGTRRLRRARMEMVVADRDGQTVAIGHGDLSILDATTYDRIRGAARGAVPPPERRLAPVQWDLVGRSSPDDVVLAHTPEGYVLELDGRHPVFFDHLLDHIPGLALIEACRQAACIELSDPASDFYTFEASFDGIVEFEPYPMIATRVQGHQAEFKICHDSVVAFEATATIVRRALATPRREGPQLPREGEPYPAVERSPELGTATSQRRVPAGQPDA